MIGHCLLSCSYFISCLFCLSYSCTNIQHFLVMSEASHLFSFCGSPRIHSFLLMICCAFCIANFPCILCIKKNPYFLCIFCSSSWPMTIIWCMLIRWKAKILDSIIVLISYFHGFECFKLLQAKVWGTLCKEGACTLSKLE